MRRPSPRGSRSGGCALLPHLLALLASINLACGGVPEGAEPGAGEPLVRDESALGEAALRVMAANITSGSGQSYDLGHGTRIFQGTDPDVVLIQEFNVGNNSDPELRAWVDSAFGTSFQYSRESGAQIPNGVISRWPILAAGEWDDPRVSNRDFAWARIDVPGPKDLWAVSVHLLTTNASERNSEARALVQFIKAQVPAGDYLVIGGDFNTGSRSESCLGTLSEVVKASGPWPTDKNGNGNTNASRKEPYDWVLVDADLTPYQVPTVIGSSTFSNGLVVDTRVFSPLAEISPARSGDSGAQYMQHMAVIRDFRIPADGAGTQPTATVRVTAPNGGEVWAGGSNQTITWTSSGVSTVKVEYTLDGSTWAIAASSVSAAAGAVGWTVPSSPSTSARVRVSDAAGLASDTSDAPFSLTVSSGGGTVGTVLINEVLANEPGSSAAGEFIELFNPGDSAVSLDGWTLSDAAMVRHTFASGTALGAGEAVVVFGSGASSGALGLSNSSDTVTLRRANGSTVDTVSYGSTLSSSDGVSMTRATDGSVGASFVLHNSVSSLASSPGTRVDGTAFGGGGGTGGGSSPPPQNDTSISAESESNDSAATADGEVGLGRAVSGTISTSTDVDWFRFTATGAGTLTIRLEIASSADLDWHLYREGDLSTYVARGYSSRNPETATYTVPSAGSYLLKVNGYSGATGSYALTVSGP